MELEGMEVVVIGSMMMDLVTYADALPKVGETVFGSSFVTSFGGKGANQAVQCARLGIKSALIGRLGMDKHGDDYLEQLKKEGVFRGLLKRPRGLATGTASIQVDAAGQNTIIIVPGANTDFTEMDMICTEFMIERAAVVLCQNEIPVLATRAALEYCRKHNTVSVLNPAPASNELKALIPLCDILCPNEVELGFLTGMPVTTNEEVAAAADALLAMGCKVVVVTLGGRGAFLGSSHDGNKQFFTAPKVEAVDTVGAGDSFIGSFASFIARGVSLDTAIQHAISCASLSVTKRGSQISFPRLADIADSDLNLPVPPTSSTSNSGSSSSTSKAVLRSLLKLC